MQLTIDLPYDVVRSLEFQGDDLPSIINEGIRAVRSRSSPGYRGLWDVLDLLATLPNPTDVLELRPTPELQARIEEVLEKNRTNELTEADRQFWASYEFVEHFVQRAKLAAQSKIGQ